jgi:mono/diheme cytochrome c family protein
MVGSSPVIAALSTGHKLGLIVVAAIFIVFALVSSFVLPRRNPDFPGKNMAAFIGVTVALFAAMLAAVVIFGAEPKAKEKASESPAAPAAPSSGNATHGKSVFASAGCTGCHSIDGSFVAGPSLKGVAGSKQTLADGTTVTADHAYLVESIEDPGKQVVKCPNCGPPSAMLAAIKPHQISAADANDLAAYIETLK